MAESILLFANDNVWTQDLNRKSKYWVHGVLITLGTILLTAGAFIEYDAKGSNAKHFTSNHGLTGKKLHPQKTPLIHLYINFRNNLRKPLLDIVVDGSICLQCCCDGQICSSSLVQIFP